ncbi:MAG: formylglycine-generating enzyme family protein [Dehalococcoidia bacterium]
MGASPEEQGDVLQFGWSPDWFHHIKPLVGSSGSPHVVYLDSFYIDKYEVTNSQYKAFVDATGHPPPTFWGQDQFNHPDQPVVGVSWHDASTFCTWAGKRLPTETEWEKAARGPRRLAYPWGNIWDSSKLWSADGIATRPLDTFDAWTLWRLNMLDASEAGPAKAGSYPRGASPYGVMDMAGNVWEWVADWYDSHYYVESPERNPQGPSTGQRRVLRGGAWDVPKVVAYTWFRENFIPPEFSKSFVTGFRCAMSVQLSSPRPRGNRPGFGR